jgi:hypothetical protein
MLGISRSAWLTSLAAAVVGCLIIWFLTNRGVEEYIEALGNNVPTDNVLVDYGKGVIWAILLGLSILVWPVNLGDKLILLCMWLVRCVVMLVFMLPYEEHYPGLDCWFYFTGAHAINMDIISVIARGGSDFVVLLGSLHLKIGPDSYHAMKVSSGYVGLGAIFLLYRAAVVLMRSERRWVFWVLGLYPSILFWSSILGKDPLVLFGIALHIWGLIHVVYCGKRKHLFAVVAGLALAAIIRIWMGPILLVPALGLFALRIRHNGWRLLTVSAVLVSLAVLAPATASRLEIDPAADLFASTQSFNKGFDKANSAMRPDFELTSLTDLLLFTPQSVFAAFFRPLPGDLPHLLGWVAGCEDLVLLILSAWALLKIRRSCWRNHLFLWGVTLIMVWGLAYSLVTYKDLGTAVRFRLQIMPVLLGMVGFLIGRPFVTWEGARNASRG